MTLQARARWVRPVPGLLASVAVVSVDHPAHGPVVLVSRRPLVNGHTGQEMSHAGQVVLVGGAREPGEDSVAAALRELGEETGIGAHRTAPLPVGAWRGHWVTEAGFAVTGHEVALPFGLLRSARPDPREVAELILLPEPEVRQARVTVEPHAVEHHDLRPDLAALGVRWFDSPTLRVRDVLGRRQVLWGLAGHLVDEWRRC